MWWSPCAGHSHENAHFFSMSLQSRITVQGLHRDRRRVGCVGQGQDLLGRACKATLILCTQFCSRSLDFSPSLSFSLTLFLPFIASSCICHKIHHYIFAVFCLFIFGLHLEVEWLGHIVISFTYFKGIDKLFFIKDVPLPFLSEIFEKLISHILANVFLLFK